MSRSGTGALSTGALLVLLLAVLATAVVAAEGEEEKPWGNNLRWSTASEVENFGYDVYRGLTEEGPFERLTEDPIPGAGTTDEPQSYSYLDSTIEEDTVYYYYVESISMSGVREKFTPVFPSKAKSRKPKSDD